MPHHDPPVPRGLDGSAPAVALVACHAAALAAAATIALAGGPGSLGRGSIVIALGAFLAARMALAVGAAARTGGAERLDHALTDASLASLGAVAAELWNQDAALTPLVLLPLVVACRSLAIPRLVLEARVEPKTGVYNMRAFRPALERELARAVRFDRPLSLLMVDVDDLRGINAAKGHLAGDRALLAVTACLRRATRDYDVLARFGGDEFCVLLPETDLTQALAVAERVRADVERSGPELGLTVSIGAATAGAATGADELIALADRGAYRAKFSGRNSVGVPPEGDPVGEAQRVLAEVLR